MKLGGLEDFALERYFARWEFSVRHQLSASDVEPYGLSEVLALADGDARRRWDELTLAYTESTGLPALREEISKLYERIEPKHVLVVAGAEEGVLLLMHALLSAGDDAVVVTPTFQSLHSIPRAIGARVVQVQLREEKRWELDLDEIARATSSKTRVITVNFPNNPTGAHIDAGTQRRLIEIADSAGAVLFSDEVYRGLEYKDADRLPAAADLSERAVSLGVMSKSFALPGLRIGWLATRNTAVLERVGKLKDYTTICASAPSEVLALMALRARKKVLERSRAIVVSNVALATKFFDANPDSVHWVPPRAGSVAFPRFWDRDATDVSDAMATHASVLLIPGSVFGADPRHFRLGLGRKDFPEALKALEAQFQP